MDVYLMAGVHQQPDLSNYLAEGQTLTCKLVITYKMSSTSFFTAPITCVLSAGLHLGVMSLCFIPQVMTICLLL